MTSQPTTTRPKPKRKPLPSALNVITGALGLFLVVLTLLALQVRSGNDPSLSGGTSSSSGTTGSGSKAAAAATRSVVTKTS
jgi:hypothetical protein